MGAFVAALGVCVICGTPARRQLSDGLAFGGIIGGTAVIAVGLVLLIYGIVTRYPAGQRIHELEDAIERAHPEPVLKRMPPAPPGIALTLGHF